MSNGKVWVLWIVGAIQIVCSFMTWKDDMASSLHFAVGIIAFFVADLYRRQA
jgi:hypothetical protein